MRALSINNVSRGVNSGRPEVSPGSGGFCLLEACGEGREFGAHFSSWRRSEGLPCSNCRGLGTLAFGENYNQICVLGGRCILNSRWGQLTEPCKLCRGFPGGSACQAVASYSVPGSERSPAGGNSNLLQYSWLGNPMDGGAWWAMVHEVTEQLGVS